MLIFRQSNCTIRVNKESRMTEKYQMIGLAGRHSSGKSTVARVLVEKGYEVASFATPLKEALAKSFNWDVASLYDQNLKEAKIEATWNKETHAKFCEIVQENLPFEETKNFTSRREVMQYVGTDLARKHDVNFHVKQFLKKYKDKKVVCDDMRFPNEVEAVENNNGLSVFIFRPLFQKYSNHISEISLQRHKFQHVIKNDKKEKELVEKAKNFFDSILKNGTSPITEVYPQSSFAVINNESCYFAGFFSAVGRVKKKTISLKIENKNMVEKFQNFVKVKFHEKKNSITFRSHEVMEDLKLWEVHSELKVPTLIKNNQEWSYYWMKGLAEGIKGIEL